MIILKKALQAQCFFYGIFVYEILRLNAEEFVEQAVEGKERS